MKHPEKISGIYKIVNKVNGKSYIGSSKNMTGPRSRQKNHFYALRNNKHENDHLQKSYNKYGKDNFDFIIIERDIPLHALFETEQKYLDVAKLEKEKYYNVSFLAGKIEMNKETRTKLSKLKKGRRLTQEWKDNISLGLKGLNCGDKNPMYGKTGEDHPRFGIRHTKESNFKNSESNKIAQKGNKNGRYIDSIYTFYNVETKERFTGSQYEFYTKFNLEKGRIYEIVKKKYGKVSCFGWILESDIKRYLNKYQKKSNHKKSK